MADDVKPRSGIATFLRFLKLWHHPDSYLVKSGLLRSFRARRPVGPEGEPLPWLNYPFIGLLESRLNKKLRIFEYGSGNSTLFFAAHTGAVVSVEHSREWVSEISAQMPDNAELVHAEPGADYITKPNDYEPFDLILIDGLDRPACLANALDRLTDAGVIILDDSQRWEYAEAIEAAKQAGFKALPLHGPKPGSIIGSESTLFYRNQNCLDI